MARQTLTKEFEAQGHFWLPAYSDTMVAGKFAFRPGDEILLELTGQLKQPAPGPLQARVYPVIMGTLVNGEKLTLLDAFEQSHQFGAGFGDFTRVVANGALIGDHIAQPESELFHGCRAGFTCFAEWCGIRPISVCSGKTSKRGTRYKATCDPAPPLVIEVPTPKLTLRMCGWLSSPSQNWCALNWQYRWLLEISPAKPARLDWLKRLVFHFQILMCMLVGEPVAVVHESFQKPEPEPEKWGPTRDIEHLFVQRVTRAKDGLLPEQMLCPLPEIANLDAFVGKWYARMDRMRVVYDLLFEDFRDGYGVLEAGFLGMAQAVEAYHRRTSSKSYMPKKDWKKVERALGGAIPSEVSSSHRESLRSRVHYGNEFSFRKRVQLLLRRLPKKLVKRLTVNPSAFVNKVTDTRNYLTHYDANLKCNSYEGEQLLHAAQRLKMLLVALTLRDLGIPGMKILELIEGHRPTEYTLDRPL